MIQDKIIAYPRKKLFIEVLTQDVTAKSCILDLIDNSVDSYIRHKIDDKREVNLVISGDKFEIHDNCGGIDKEFLKTSVFRFGAENLNRDDPTLGMYGIGMKRSIFKIGNNITLETDDGKDYSHMELDVKDWEDKDENDWDIPFETDNTTLKNTLPFTRISIANLHKDISEKFALVTFHNDIIATLKRTYCLIIKDQIDFKLNNIKIEPDKLIVPFDKDYTPSVHIEEYQDINIHIICFLDPSKGTRLKDAVNTIGWNIFCNNRLILANDTTPVTGWIGGNDKSLLPKYHSIFNEFRGIVFLKSNNPFNLPLNTSKDNLNTEDKNYHYILDKMITTARPVIDYLGKKYEPEKEEEEAIEDIIEQNIDQNFNPSETKEADEINQPSSFNAPPQTGTKKDPMARICYSQKKNLVEKVKSFFEVNSNKEVGEKTFEYFIEREEFEND